MSTTCQDAFSRFYRTFHAVTEPDGNGGRVVPSTLDAVALSDAAEELETRICHEYLDEVKAHGEDRPDGIGRKLPCRRRRVGGFDPIIWEGMSQALHAVDTPRKQFVSGALRYHEGDVISAVAVRALERARSRIELQMVDGGEGDSLQAPEEWTRPPGYVGTKDICNDRRFQKNGKNPPRSTIGSWWTTDAEEDRTLKKVPDPATGEIYYPEEWVIDRFKRWSPRP